MVNRRYSQGAITDSVNRTLIEIKETMKQQNDLRERQIKEDREWRLQLEARLKKLKKRRTFRLYCIIIIVVVLCLYWVSSLVYGIWNSSN
ncbi:unnamed protein product [Bursaphelenchus okinawaensis]|uniref:Uncharacterized protein n=1 Tax=Bursaphelenchus okinawaensis TaxID=465554 RepID=A0A811LSN4_9BILA|nr:unnamed protein product [Bursaphelenchus okinawaensis]CAG9128393.1 unnamed protein product [Bursaphelenchus okinawaensis]